MAPVSSSENKTVGGHTKFRAIGDMYTAYTWKWINNKMVLIYEESQGYDETSGKYIRTIRTLKNGKWIFKKVLRNDPW